MGRRLPALLLLVALVVAACSDDDDSTGGDSSGSDTTSSPSTTALPAAEFDGPDDPAFYVPPDDLAAYENGDVIWTLEVPAPDGVRAWKVLYRSEAIDGTAIAVSGVVAAPDAEAPDGGYPVMTWAHGTSGTADECAPSRSEDPASAVFAFGEVVDAGYVGVATDYEGLGTPGLHPYLVGVSQGRGVLDIARAAQAVTDASNRVVVWGVSQGGHAALFAGSIAPDYAPDLDVLGVVAAAPPGDLTVLGAAAASPVLAGFALMVGGGYEAAYGDVSLDELMGPDYERRLEILETACVGEVFESTREDPLELLAPVDQVEPWPDLLRENSPVNLDYEMPLLVLQGVDDAIVPKGLTDSLVDKLCADGVTVDYRTFEATGHGQEITRNFPAALEWAGARFAGGDAASTCT